MDERLRAGVRDEDRKLEHIPEAALNVTVQSVGESISGEGEIKEFVAAMDAQALLMHAFEKLGMIEADSVEKMEKTINRLVNNSTPSTKINDLRDNQSLEAGEEAAKQQSETREMVNDLINIRLGYDAVQINELRAWGREYFRIHKELPSAQIILKGLIWPERGASSQTVTDEAADLAPDIIWMIEREDEIRRKEEAEAA